MARSSNLHSTSELQTRLEKVPAISFCIGQKPKQAGVSTNLIIKSSNAGNSRYAFIEMSDQQSVFSAKGSVFRPKIAAPQYRSRELGGRTIKSVIPGADPIPQWCPAGLTHTQKRQVQRLRAIELKEEQVKKLLGMGFDKNKTVVSIKKVWMPKQMKEFASDDENSSLVSGGSSSN